MKPKYEIGQRVWLIKDSKAQEDEIVGVFKQDNIPDYHPEIYFKYSLRENNMLLNSLDLWKYEGELFPTKEELIKSL